MRNILIAGPSRSGKSTLARMLHDKFGYYVISIDKLVAVFQESYPQLDIRLNWNRDKTTENIAPFLGHYLGMFSSSDGRGLHDYSHGSVADNRFILEGAYYDLDKISSVLKTYGIDDMSDRFELIGLVQRQKDADAFFNDFRKYDTTDDWTYSLSDQELKAVCEDAVSFNEEMYQTLTKHGFTIYDTSVNREEVFSKMIAKLKG